MIGWLFPLLAHIVEFRFVFALKSFSALLVVWASCVLVSIHLNRTDFYWLLFVEIKAGYTVT